MGTVILSTALCLTNLAGNVMTATPVRIDGAAVVLARSATTQTVALAAFSATEQARIRAVFGERRLPSGLAGLRSIYVAELERAEARRAGGAMSEEAFRKKAEKVRRAWERSLEKGKYGLSAEERAYWKGHLR